MKKRLSILLALVMALTLLPLSAMAAGTALETKYFPNGKISAPLVPYLKYSGVDTINSDSIELWYNVPTELLTLTGDMSRWEQSGKSEEFLNQFGVYDYTVTLQTDAKIDGGSWLYTSEWDDPEWYGFDVPTYLAFACYEYLGVGSDHFYDVTTLSWLTYLEEGSFGFLAPIVKTATSEYGDTVYNYDLSNHTLAVRTRYAVRIHTLDDQVKMVFSDWSPETSIGKNGTQRTISKPASLAAPTLSEFSVTVNKDDGSREGRYFLNVPESIFDALLYCEAQEGMFEPMHLEAQMRVNGGAWDDAYTANPQWIFSNYRSAAPENAALKESDSVEVRVRFVCEPLGLVSAWSNIVGTSALNASSWAQSELAEADALGLIPDSLKDADLTRPITRAEFAAVSVKVYEALTGTKAQPIAANPFTDTADAEVLKAFNVGVTNGTGDGTTFSPNVLLNREQAATMLTRVYKKVIFGGWTLATDGSFNAQFKAMFTAPAPFADDARISDWAKDSVYFMAAKGVINGVGDNTFAPRATTTAEEAAGYAQATREVALLIAVRMVKNLA